MDWPPPTALTTMWGCGPLLPLSLQVLPCGPTPVPPQQPGGPAVQEPGTVPSPGPPAGLPCGGLRV